MAHHLPVAATSLPMVAILQKKNVVVYRRLAHRSLTAVETVLIMSVSIQTQSSLIACIVLNCVDNTDSASSIVKKKTPEALHRRSIIGSRV